MAFDKEFGILYGFCNLRISKKATLQVKSPIGVQNISFYEFVFDFMSKCI